MAKDTKTPTKTDPKTDTPPQAGAGDNAPAAQASADGPANEGGETTTPPAGVHIPDGTRILRKMSPKTVMGRIKPPFPGDMGDPSANPPRPPRSPDPEQDLYVVMGQTNGVQTGDGDYGPWVAFKGWFEAARCDTGEISQSGLCFVPKAFEEALLVAVKAQQEANAGGMVEFAVKISIIPSTKAAAGYEFQCRNLIKTQTGDPLKALRNTLRSAGTLPALPAPKAAA